MHLVVVCPNGKLKDHSWVNTVKAYNEATNSHLDVDCYSYDSIHGKNARWIYAKLNSCKDAGIMNMVIFDEMQLIKNPTSQRGSSCIALAKNDLVSYVLGLSATPVPNSYLDTETYLIIAGFYRNKTHFEQEQVKAFNEYHQPIVKNKQKQYDRNLFTDPDKLDTFMESLCVTADTSSLLPPVIKTDLKYHIDDTHPYVENVFDRTIEDFSDQTPRTRYGHMRQAAKYHREGVFDSISTLNNILYQLAAFDPQRLQLTIDVIKHHWQHNPQPIIIFYTRVLEYQSISFHLKQVFPDAVINQINGQQKDLEPVSGKHIIFVQYRAGGTGIELPYAPVTIFYMPTWSNQDFDQAQGRNVRPNMKDYVYHYFIHSDREYDQQCIWPALDQKIEFNISMILKFEDALLSEKNWLLKKKYTDHGNHLRRNRNHKRFNALKIDPDYENGICMRRLDEDPNEVFEKLTA